MKIAIASDHAAVDLKAELREYLIGLGHEVADLGPETADRVDYPDFGYKLAAVVADGTAERGVALCGSMADLVPGQQIAEVTRLLRAPYANTFGATETGLAPASTGKLPVGEAPRLAMGAKRFELVAQGADAWPRDARDEAAAIYRRLYWLRPRFDQVARLEIRRVGVGNVLGQDPLALLVPTAAMARLAPLVLPD